MYGHTSEEEDRRKFIRVPRASSISFKRLPIHKIGLDRNIENNLSLKSLFLNIDDVVVIVVVVCFKLKYLTKKQTETPQINKSIVRTKF